MPIDLNQHNLESLTEQIQTLPPGRSLVTNDGLVVRRRHRSSGYDCGVGLGGHASRRANTAREAADDMLKNSAARTTPESLGGSTNFKDYEAAIESVRKGESLPSGPSPAVKALRRVAVRAGLHSYRVRAQQARDALAKGEVARAMRQMEAIVEHAGSNGRFKDVKRAQSALDAILEHHDVEGRLPELTETVVEIRTRGDQHYVFQNGREVAGPLNRTEAESRKHFLTRTAARAEDVRSIEKEIAELPSSLLHDDEEVRDEVREEVRTQ